MDHSNHLNHKHSPIEGSNPCIDKLTDIEYLEHMIPHHQVAIDMSHLLIPHTNNPKILHLCRDIIRKQSYEIWEMEMMKNELSVSLFDENLIQKALDIYKEKVYNSSEYDSLIATYKFKHFLMDNNGPINYKLGKQHTNSQDLPDLYLFTNGIIITTLENVRKFKCWFGGPKHYKFLVDQKQSIDIDTEEDYIIAKAFYNEIKNK